MEVSVQPASHEAGSEVSLAAAALQPRPGCCRQPPPRTWEGMAEAEGSGLQVLLHTLQVGRDRGRLLGPLRQAPRCWAHWFAHRP